MRAKRKKKFERYQNEGAQMSNELERAGEHYGGEFRIIGADGVGLIL